MEINTTYINVFYGFMAVILLSGIFWVKPKAHGWSFYIFTIIGFAIGGLTIGSVILAGAAFVAGVLSFIKYRQFTLKSRTVEVILVADPDDHYLHHFLEYYKADISKHFPKFDFTVEDEFLVALLVSQMETVGLIVAEIKNAETIKICVDYLVPKYRESQLAKTFYQCELRCINFLGYPNLYMEPQSKVHNLYLERIGFRLVDGKYVNRISGE